MIKKMCLLIALVLVLMLSACSGSTVQSSSTATNLGDTGNSYVTSPIVEEETSETSVTYDSVSVEYDSDDLDAIWDENGATCLTLSGDSIKMEGDGAIVDDCKVTITSTGTYILSGTLDDGQILVNTRESGTVKIVLNGVSIACDYGAPISILNTDKAVIVLADGSSNYIADSDTYSAGDSEDETTAAIYSKCDLTINGNGSLVVEGNYKNGVQSKDDLKIISGDITVSAVSDGLKGKDCIAVKGGSISITAGGDGMQATNDADGEKGFIVIEDGTLDITAENDGIQAETNLLIAGGSISILSGGGSINSSTGDNWGVWGDRRMEENNPDSDSTASAKGLKAGIDITIEGGSIDIDSSDDSIHSNRSLTINDGNIIIASGDDGVHSDSTLVINGGNIEIAKSYEGIESVVITINDGVIRIVSSDDGINASGGVDSSSVNGRPGQNTFDSSANCYLYLNGGYIVVNATGDGLDINGSIYMSGGTVIVNGPVNDANGAMDYLGEWKVTGGFLVAAGSAGMAQAPSTSSTQYSIICNYNSSLSAGTVFRIEDEDGENIVTFTPLKNYQSVVVCSPELKKGDTYVIFAGGSVTGTAEDGLYTTEEYTPGTEVTSFTISSTVTSIGSYSEGVPGGEGFNRDRRP